MEFKKASRKQSKLRMAICGPSGSGKTYSSLAIATGISKKIGVIDTENGSAAKLSGEFEFDALNLPDYSIETYVKAINKAAREGYEVIIVDSLTHAWQELLTQVEKIAQAQFRGNTWSAWSKGTPMQRALVSSIVNCPAHLICTMRSKTEWVTEKNDRGKNVPVKVGLSPEQGKGIEYEFDFLCEIDQNHYMTISKSRYSKFQGKILEKPGVSFGEELAKWLNEGEKVEFNHHFGSKDELDQLRSLFKEINYPDDQIVLGLQKAGVTTLEDIPKEKILAWTQSIQKRADLLKEDV